MINDACTGALVVDGRTSVAGHTSAMTGRTSVIDGTHVGCCRDARRLLSGRTSVRPYRGTGYTDSAVTTANA
jgi:hypothetical protein